VEGREEIGNEKICIIAGVGVHVGGDGVVARPSAPSSSSVRFRETRCWRLRWIGLHRRFFFATLPDACSLVFVPSTTRFVRPVRRGEQPTRLRV
jgi:hypothetical protein